MADHGRAAASQDPLERYRQALRRQSGLDSQHEVAKPLPSEEPTVSDDVLELDEPLAEEAPLELDEPLAEEAPVELDEPLAEEDPLDLDEMLDEDEPLELDQSTAPEDLPKDDQPRNAADWLGLDDEYTGEDPLGLDDTSAAGAAPQSAPVDPPSGTGADDDVPEELQGTLARYQMAMNKLRSQRAADAPDPLAGSGETAADSDAGTVGDSELLSRFRQARRRQLEMGSSESEPPPASSLSHRARGRLLEDLDENLEEDLDEDLDQDLGEVPEAADADDLVRDFPIKAQVSRRARRRTRPDSQAALGWSTRAITFAVLLFAALPVQWLVYRQLGADFAIADLGAGLSALLPAALILLLARPASGKGRMVIVLGSGAVGLIGSAGFAYGLSLLQSQLPEGTSLVFGLLLSLGLFTAVWGPLFLILVPILSRVSVPARSKS